MSDNDYDKIREDIIDALNVADFYLDMMYTKSNRLFWKFTNTIQSFQKLLDTDTTGKYDSVCNELIEIYGQYCDLMNEQQQNAIEIGKYVDDFEKYRQ